MGTLVPIVEVLSDGKYHLNEEVLTSIVSAAEECERVAIISIIGWEGPEERFVLNCLANYLNAQNKEKWPDFTQNVNICGSIDDKENNPLVWMWSKPFILKDDDQNTAVFLMDANHVFNSQTEDSNTCFAEDIIDLFCGTSSTLIYLKREQFDVYELTAFKSLVEKVFDRSLSTSYEELIYLVINWDSKDKNYLFGAKGGQQYMNEFSVNLDQLFNETKCYLLPSIGADLNDKELVFGKIGKKFVEEFLKFIGNKLLNIDEMNVKKGEDSENILPNDLVALFCGSVQRLNDQKCGETNSEESFEEKKRMKQSLSIRSSESGSDIEVIDTEEQRVFELYSDEEQESSGQSTVVANDLMENTVKEEESLKQWCSGDQQINESEPTPDRLNDFGVAWNHHLMSTQEEPNITNIVGETNLNGNQLVDSLKVLSTQKLIITEKSDNQYINDYKIPEESESNYITENPFTYGSDIKTSKTTKTQLTSFELNSLPSDSNLIDLDSDSPFQTLKLSQPEVTVINVINSDQSSTSKDSDQPFEEIVVENQENNEIKETSNELMEHKIERTADIDKSNSKEHKIDGQSDEDRTDSNNTEDGEEPFTDLSYDTYHSVSDSTEPFVLIEKYKNIHLTQLKNYISTTKFITRQELLENHKIFVNEIKEHFNNEVKNRSEDRIKELNDSIDLTFTSNYEEIGHEIDRRREELKEEKPSELILIFCAKLNAILRNEELIAKIIWEKRIQEIEQIVYQDLNQDIGQKDPLLEQEISVQLTGKLDRFKFEFMRKMNDRWNIFMNDYQNKAIVLFKNRMEEIILAANFSSIQIFHSLLNNNHIENEIFKKFDLKFNVNHGFDDNYPVVRADLRLKLNDIKKELQIDYNIRQDFEMHFNHYVEEYDNKMKSLIESKLENQKPTIFEFKTTEAELMDFHIESKDNIFKVLNVKHETNEDKRLKFTERFDKKFQDAILEKFENYRRVVKTVENYLNDWNKNLSKKPYIKDIEKHNVIIQRRHYLFDVWNPFVKQYSRELLGHILPQIERINQNKKNEFRQTYDKLLSNSVKIYENHMRISIESKLRLRSYDMDLVVIHDKFCKDIHTYFRSEIKNFDNSGGFLDEYILILTKQLKAKKSKFQTSVDQINVYRNNWMNHLNDIRFLSGEEMIKMNKQLMDQFINSGDQELDSIVKTQMERVFDDFIERIDKIGKSEANITENVIENITNLFEKRFDNRLRSDLFNRIEVNQMFDKLLDYTFDRVVKRCDFNEYQEHLNKNCKNQIDVKLRHYLMKAFAKHSQNSVNVKSLKSQAIDSSVELYANEMKTIITSLTGITRTEYHTKSKELKTKALNYFDEQMETIIEYFNVSFYQNLLKESHKQIKELFDLKESEFLEFIQKNTPKETSIAIYFGRFDLLSIGFEEGFPSPSIKIDVSPNCIAIDNKIMVGTEALNYYKKSKNEIFDIKSILIMSSDRNQIIPFHMTYENKVRVRTESEVQDLSVESLIALQVLDIKTNTENKTNSVVKSAVFTVPTHYSIKQKNAMKDVANIAGLERVDILTEITAAALAFASDTTRPDRHSVSYNLFVAMNENKCDSAVCQISSKEIKYKSHFQHEFTAEEVLSIQRAKGGKDHYKSVKNIFKILTEDVSHKKHLIKYLKNVVIIGSSDLIPELRYYIQNSKKYRENETGIYECDPIKIIVKGSAIYGNTFYRKHFDITEVSLYPITYISKTSYSATGFTYLTDKNTALPFYSEYMVGGPINFDNYPVIIEFYQYINYKKQMVDVYHINPSQKDSHRMFNQTLAVIPHYFHNIIIGVKDTGDPEVRSVILNPSNSELTFEFQIRRVRFGLTLEDIVKEKKFIQSLSMKSSIKEPQTNPMSALTVVPKQAVDPQLERSKQELETLYLKVKERIEKCDKLSELLRETFEQQLNETLAVINSKESNRHKFDANKQFLEKIMQKTERFIK